MLRQIAVALAACAAVGAITTGTASATPTPADDNPPLESFLNRPTHVGTEDTQDRLQTCYHDFYANPSARICS